MKMRFVLATTLIFVTAASGAYAQGRGGPPGPPPTPKTAARIDITGYWVSLVTEDWRYRQFTPPKGDYESVPINTGERGPLCARAGGPGRTSAPGIRHRHYRILDTGFA